MGIVIGTAMEKERKEGPGMRKLIHSLPPLVSGAACTVSFHHQRITKNPTWKGRGIHTGFWFCVVVIFREHGDNSLW